MHRRYKASKRWQARLCTGRKQYHLGYYLNEAEAARAYDRAILASPTPIHAQLNFPAEAGAVRRQLSAQQPPAARSGAEGLLQAGPIHLATTTRQAGAQAAAQSLMASLPGAGLADRGGSPFHS